MIPLDIENHDKPTEFFDVECYRNYFLVKLYGLHSKTYRKFELHAWAPNGLEGLRNAMLSPRRFITFNGNKYDMLMVSAAIAGFNTHQLKELSDAIIMRRPSPQPWMLAREFGFEIIEPDHIDLFELAPGQSSLKIYGGRLHCKRMQDLPIDPATILTQEQMQEIDIYCGNDLITTADLYESLKDDIDTRIELSKQYGVDMRSKSDAQIAEAAFKTLLPFTVKKPDVVVGSQFYYTAPAFINFRTPGLQAVLATILRNPYTIDHNGTPQMTEEIANLSVRIGAQTYTLGSGGLHSTEQNASHYSDAIYSLRDVDVVSYYPKIISILRMYPDQIGPIFIQIHDGWIEVRIEHKKAGRKKKATTFKIKINGTFGKTGSRWSILYAPRMMITTTVTGQLSLLMLIEMLHLAGIDVVSANTDGVVIKCRRDMHHIRDAIVANWERITGFETEANDYRALFSRDVNSYMAFKYPDDKNPRGEIKTKGAFADAGLAKNPANVICVDAVKEYILEGTPLEKTIRGCADIRKFVTVRNVAGGGSWVQGTIEAATVGAKRNALTALGWLENGKDSWWPPVSVPGQSAMALDQAIKAARAVIPRTYLGKAVRWYYGAGQKGHICNKKGDLVARSEGAKPCMDLPDILPPDINYDWYVEEAKNLLKDLNIC